MAAVEVAAGSVVLVEFEGEWFNATIQEVLSSSEVKVVYDDGTEEDVPLERGGEGQAPPRAMAEEAAGGEDEEEEAARRQPAAADAEELRPPALAAVLAVSSGVPPPDAAAIAAAAAAAQGEWYLRELGSGQPVGPLSTAHLRNRWRWDQVNGLTQVWRPGEPEWRPLAEVPELKDAVRARGAGAATSPRGRGSGDAGGEPPGEGAEEDAALPRRRPLDELPLTHTFTSGLGELYAYDEVDGGWATSELYEALAAEDAAAGESLLGGPDAAAANALDVPMGLPEDAKEALKELLADVGEGASAAAPGAPRPARPAPRAAAEPRARGCRRRQAAVARPGSCPCPASTSRGSPTRPGRWFRRMVPAARSAPERLPCRIREFGLFGG